MPLRAGVVSRNIQRKPSSIQSRGLPQISPGSREVPVPEIQDPNRAARAHPQLSLARPLVTSVKVRKIRGKGGVIKEQYDLIVNIDLDVWQLSKEVVADLKEVFMLFDKDEDGVLSFPELEVVMKNLGQVPTETELLRMVREVSEDKVYDTIEFNEFLQMISKQRASPVGLEDLVDAFRIFDTEDDGRIPLRDFRKAMEQLGDPLSSQQLDGLLKAADPYREGAIRYREFCEKLLGHPEDGQGEKTKHGKEDENENNSFGALDPTK